MAKPMKILVTDKLADKGIEMLTVDGELEVDVQLKKTPEELAQIVGNYDGWVVRSGTQVTKELLEKATNMKVIGRAGAGLDNIDVPTASKQGIVVMNAAGGNTISTAEHTVSMLLSLSRNIPQACASLKAGEWKRADFMGVEVYGKTLGVVGLGRIGAEVAKRCVAFGMRVLAFDPHLGADKIRELEAEPIEDVNEIFKRADYITVHTPLTDGTRGLISKEQLAMMKDGVRIINCARGGIVNEPDLVEAIKSGKVAGAAFDVYEQEPPEYRELIELPEVVATPHLGASTEEAQLGVAVSVAESVRDCLMDKGVRNAVNVPSVDPEVLRVLDPYIQLTERIGRLHAEFTQGGVQEVRIRYVGDLVKWDLSPLTLALLKGLLTPVLQETVNFVNAGFIAKERGIKVVESKASDAEDFASLVSVEIVTDQGANTIQGTLFTRTDARIVRINDFYMDAVSAGPVLVVRNEDKPGMVGQIGCLLGEAGINMASMSLGRQDEGGEAMIVVNLDQPVSAELLEQIKNIEHVLEAKFIEL